MSGVQVPSPPPTSPVAPPGDVLGDIAGALDASLAPLVSPGDRVLVAFSGGPDSTALLAAVARLADERGLAATALHVDHRLDAGSGDRAAAAAGLARRLGVDCAVVRLPAPGERPRRGREDAARRRRYDLLARHAASRGARWILTAHHADDQAETVLLRLLFGSGLEGLAGIRPRRGRVLRPLLGLRRGALAAAVAATGLDAVDDPTNRDLATPRNRVRHLLLPRLEAADPHVVARLAALAAAAGAARRRWTKVLAESLDLAPAADDASCDLGRLRALDPALHGLALALLHRRAGAGYPAPESARRELRRQLAAGGRVGCDCGGGRRWESAGGRLRLRLGDGGAAGGTADPDGVYSPGAGRVVRSPGRAPRVAGSAPTSPE